MGRLVGRIWKVGRKGLVGRWVSEVTHRLLRPTWSERIPGSCNIIQIRVLLTPFLS